MAENANALAVKVTYNTLGKEITLTSDMVRKYLTKGNGNVTDAEILQFISICKYQELNPFLNEAYLVKFANNRGGEDAAQIITSKEAFMKRAEACDNFDGMRAGIIVNRNGEIIDLEGSFLLETDILLGGWAEVHRTDRHFPSVARVSMKEYGKGRSTWNAIPATMIRKVAEVQALREAFPTQLGAMYTREEALVEDAEYTDVTPGEAGTHANAQKLPIGGEQKPKATAAPAAPAATEAPVVNDGTLWPEGD